ncbi:MAG: hypothetical protein ACREDF_05615, partial [Thermoplasmata archaeon]
MSVEPNPIWSEGWTAFGTWTEEDVNGLQAGIELASVGTASTVRVPQVLVTVNTGDFPTYAVANGPTGMKTLTSMTRGGVTTSFACYANGSLDTKTAGRDFDWNAENLMTLAKQNGAQQEAYRYDGLGRRAKADGAAGPSTWTVSIVSGMDVIYEKDNAGTVTKYLYANGMRIAKITPTGAVRIYAPRAANHGGRE